MLNNSLKHNSRFWLLTLAISAQFFTAGCSGGGGGLFGLAEALVSLFGGGSATSSVFSFLTGGASESLAGSALSDGGTGVVSDILGGLTSDGAGGSTTLASLDSGVSGTEGGLTGISTTVNMVATIHNPEPFSAALFGGGLAATMCWRRRKMRKSPRPPSRGA